MTEKQQQQRIQSIRRVLNYINNNLDIVKHASPNAIFDPLHQGFNIWCTPDNHPKGDWAELKDHMDRGAWSKKCAFVATVWYDVKTDKLEISAYAYLLYDHAKGDLKEKYPNHKSVHNLPDDIEWVKEKVKALFFLVNEPCPEFVVDMGE